MIWLQKSIKDPSFGKEKVVEEQPHIHRVQVAHVVTGTEVGRRERESLNYVHVNF